MTETQNYRQFQLLYYVTHIFGCTAILLVSYWMISYVGLGFRDEPEKEFRWHPMLMSLGMLFLNGEAILIYRGFRWTKKSVTKLVHLSLQAVGFLIAVFGFITVLDSHNFSKDATGKLDPKPNFLSFHSWVGITTLSLFLCQFLGGFYTFFWPGATLKMKKDIMPFHRAGGLIIFIGSLSSALLGLSEKVAWSMNCWNKDRYLCAEMLISNLFGLSLLVYACGVIILVTYGPWQRLPLPSEEGYVARNEDESLEPCINNRRRGSDE